MIYAVIKSQKADVSRLCKSAGVSRSGYYRYLHKKPRPDPDIEIRDLIQRICLKSSSYGYRYVTKALHRQGYDNLILRTRAELCKTRETRGSKSQANWIGTIGHKRKEESQGRGAASEGWKELKFLFRRKQRTRWSGKLKRFGFQTSKLELNEGNFW